MATLKEILREEYEKNMAALMDPNALLKLIAEVMEVQTPIEEQVATPEGVTFDPQEMLLKMIPDIAVSEIGWSDVRTIEEDGELKQISGPQRRLLEDYLANVEGNDFASKIHHVSAFYNNGAALIDKGSTSREDRIVKAISYLVFYKTLTKVVTNFNAASAGFSFESFLATLVRGEQIEANTGTIADYVDRVTGKDIPVSLKLYKEKKLEVGGSYTDLVNDLVNPKYSGLGNAMRYVVCTKELTGEKLEQAGKINFWQFDFTLENVMAILTNSKKTSQECIRLPRAIVSALQGNKLSGLENVLGLPQREIFPSAQELETDEFIPGLEDAIAAHQQANPQSLLIRMGAAAQKDLVNDLGWAKNDALFAPSTDVVKDPETGEKQKIDRGIIRGRSTMPLTAVKAWLGNKYKALESDIKLQQLFGVRDDDGFNAKQRQVLARRLEVDLNKLIRGVNAKIVAAHSPTEKKDKRKEMIGSLLAAEEFLSPAESAMKYSQMSEPQRKIALVNTLGYLETLHFSLNQAQATNPEPPNWQERTEENPENPRKLKVIKGGTGAEYLGSIQVGTAHVAAALNQVRDLLNEEVYEIFQSLKILSDSLNSFFAGGLKNDNLATSAIDNAKNIQAKEILQPDE